MNIDAHQHYWDPARGDYGWLTPDLKPLYRVFGSDDLAPLRKITNVKQTVVVQAAATVDETRYLLDLARDDESIAGVVGWVPLDSVDAVEIIDEFARDKKFKAVRPMLQDLPDDTWIDHAPRPEAIQRLIELDLAFDALIFARHVPSLVEFAGRYPALRIVVDHGAKPPIRDGEAGWQPWADGIAQLAALPQRLYCKLSGLATEASPSWTADTLAPYVAHLIDQFGHERLMWGSDWPVLNLNGCYTDWHAAARRLVSHLEKAEEDAIFGGNARAFYRL
ncbi:MULTISPECIES: amidohydrolase [unclassified Caballeronia]|uniref:amidohydrolase family protein n=1 Tax=unclassified Caballeronia TaxID=2646786 RepID=UPI002028DD45|nr:MULTISPECIES: amidohydrolase family protein [unclassified Caballeronia]MDR5776158.1 amidohydrolase family protein [Caballeronia sp. LZ002]MDR5851598.1 amidohydrolase family protein [Caballeronia sp. LZ003]